MSAWHITYCDEHIELRPAPGLGPRFTCKRASCPFVGIEQSASICHRCSCSACHEILAAHRALCPPPARQLEMWL